jgi:hypothetical protein
VLNLRGLEELCMLRGHKLFIELYIRTHTQAAVSNLFGRTLVEVD